MIFSLERGKEKLSSLLPAVEIFVAESKLQVQNR